VNRIEAGVPVVEAVVVVACVIAARVNSHDSVG